MHEKKKKKKNDIDVRVEFLTDANLFTLINSSQMLLAC